MIGHRPRGSYLPERFIGTESCEQLSDQVVVLRARQLGALNVGPSVPVLRQYNAGSEVLSRIPSIGGEHNTPTPFRNMRISRESARFPSGHDRHLGHRRSFQTSAMSSNKDASRRSPVEAHVVILVL
jgi:hypothetical protein